MKWMRASKACQMKSRRILRGVVGRGRKVREAL